MSHQPTRREFFRHLAGAGAGLALGAGFGSCGSEPRKSDGGKGFLRLRLAWSGRFIPPEAQSVRIKVMDRSGRPQTQVLRRAAGETEATFEVWAGPVTVAAWAYATDDATGEVLAQAQTTVTAVEGQTTPVNLTLVPAERPNILFILLDDLRWDALGCTGHPFVLTPNIDRIANEGVRFSNAFVTTSLCSPSRASFLTGAYAHRHGVRLNAVNDPDPSFPLLPQLLQQAGYETALIGKWHMKPGLAPRPGFDHWYCAQYPYENPRVNENGRGFQAEGYITDLLMEEAVRWLRQPRQEPFFLLLAPIAPHSPYTPAARHASFFADVLLEKPVSFDDTLETKPAWQRALRVMPGKPVPPAIPPGPWDPQNPNMLNYFRTLLAVDEGVGEVLATLEELGQLDSTVVVFTSDNGFIWGEHQIRNNKRAMYEESIRIPLLIRYPLLVPPGWTAQEMVLTLDLAPTFLELAGVELPDTLQGQSLVPCLMGSNDPWRTSFLYEYFSYPDDPFPTMLGVRTERAKYVTYPEIEDLDELYDLENDPFELNNLAVDPDAEPLLAEMRQELQRLMDETGYVG